MADYSVITVGTTMATAKSIAEQTTSVSVSHTMDMASSLQFTVHDKDFAMLRANYFQIRRQVYFRNEIFEIASMDVGPGPSGDPQVSVECFPRAVQKMKRDKKPRNYGSTSSYDYVKTIARKFNLYFVGQPTSKTQSIPQAKNEKTDESVWDVVKRLADDAEFVCFVVSIPYEKKTKKEGILFFISQKKLLKLWGPTEITGKVKVNGKLVDRKVKFLPIEFPHPDTENRFIVLELPTFRKSDNDWREAEGSAVLWNDPRGNAQMIRPGMTVRIRNYAPDFNGYYIITSVEWSEDEPGPVKLQFRTPEFPKTNSSANNSSGDEGTSTVTSQSRQDNLDFIASYIGREAVAGFSDKDDAFVQNYVNSIVQASETANQAFTDWMKD